MKRCFPTQDSRRRAYLLGAIAICWIAAAQAAPITIVSDDVGYDVHQDATYVYEETESFRINTAQAVTQFSQYPMLFSTSLQNLEVLEAYTTTKDGTRVDVTPDNIRVQELPVSSQAPTFSDTKVKIIVFPQVDVGATLTMHYRRTQLKTELPGVFSMRETFSKTQDFRGATVHLSAPAKMYLQVDSNGVPGGEVKSDRADMRQWKWTLPATADVPAEPGMVAVGDVSPYAEASTLRDYADIARAYAIGARAAAKVTPAIQRQADEITRGITDKRAQAVALYRWVGQQIRYVAIFMDVGGYVPHNADAILQARYGDCKDHVALLESLLAAKDIASSPVLISASTAYVIPKSPVLGAFNHAITYLPDFRLFVDSTNPFAAFGVLSDALNAKSALVVDSGHGKPELITTPLIVAKSDGMVVKTSARLEPDGTVAGQNVVTSRGVYDMLHRAILGSIPKEQLPQVAAGLLARGGQNGTADMKFGDPRDDTQPFTLEAGFQLPNRVQTPGPGAFALNFGIGSPLGIASLAASVAPPARVFPFVCAGGNREEVTSLTLPDGFTVTTLPKPVTVNDSVGSYESSYARDGKSIIVTRKLSLQFPHGTCDSAEYQELKVLATAASVDLRSQALYQ